MVLKSTCECMSCFCVLNLKEALELFRQQLLKHGTYLLKSNRHISKTEFAEALEELRNGNGCSAGEGCFARYFFRQVWGTLKDGCF